MNSENPTKNPSEDEKPRICYECEYYITTRFPKVGCCDRVGDPGFVYTVGRYNKNCIYRGSKQRRLSPQKIQQRDKTQEKEREDFDKALERVVEEVNSWPKWKREIDPFKHL